MSPLRFFTAEDPDMALVRAIRRQVFVQDLGVPEQQEFDAVDLPGADTVYALLTAEGSPLGTGRLQGAAENYKIGRIACHLKRVIILKIDFESSKIKIGSYVHLLSGLIH